MIRILLATSVLLATGIWNDAKADTTYFVCRVSGWDVDYILEEGWFGNTFYEVSGGTQEEMILSDVNDHFIYFYTSQKHKNNKSKPRYINRTTGDATAGHCVVK
jgi:hypothetical protein